MKKRVIPYLIPAAAIWSSVSIFAADPDLNNRLQEKFNQTPIEALRQADELSKKAPDQEKVKNLENAKSIPNQDKSVIDSIDTAIPTENMDLKKAKQHFLKGVDFFRQAKYLEALDKFNQSLYLDPENSQLNFLLGRANFEVGQYEEATFAYDRALLLNPMFHSARIERGKTFIALGAFAKARADFDYVMNYKTVLSPEIAKQVEYVSTNLHSERKSTVNLIVIGNLTFDSNATSGTSYDIPTSELAPLGFITPATKKEANAVSDRALAGNLILTHSYPLALEGLTWKNMGMTNAGDNRRVHANNIMLLLGNTGLNYKFQKHTWDLAYTIMRLQTGGNLSQISSMASLKYAFELSKQWNFRLAYNFTNRHHFATEDDSYYYNPQGRINGYEGGITYSYNENNSWDLSYTHNFDATPYQGSNKKAFINYHSHATNLSYSHKFNSAWSTKLTGIYKQDRYNNYDLVLNKIKRKDRSYTGKAEVTYQHALQDSKLKVAIFSLGASYKKVKSNSPINRYNSKQLIFSVTTVF